MLPDKCSVIIHDKLCTEAPQFVMSVLSNSDEFMIGLVCSKHHTSVLQKIKILQQQNKIPNGKILFNPIKSVGTDCIRSDPDSLIQLD
ncbi:MAG: hypothetical protein R1F52_05775 [Candidatus Nitrosoabyssus spongiisocia]|nr:MAG: hypothetical protein R1F52_05775 [Nitrosopumilaceae archaeon AB1(1)]